jgi:hypothetical protein
MAAFTSDQPRSDHGHWWKNRLEVGRKSSPPANKVALKLFIKENYGIFRWFYQQNGGGKNLDLTNQASKGILKNHKHTSGIQAGSYFSKRLSHIA